MYPSSGSRGQRRAAGRCNPVLLLIPLNKDRYIFLLAILQFLEQGGPQLVLAVGVLIDGTDPREQVDPQG